MQKLPVGIQSFRSIIEGGYVYVDKTELIYRMITRGVGYFLSRPRRFGKSLLASTLASLFKGEKELFKGTWISNSDYKWEGHAVLALNFSNLASESPEDLLASLNEYLVDVAEGMGVSLEPRSRPSQTFSLLVRTLRKSQKVVVLIDEYDRPLVKHLDDEALTNANRDVLQDFFTVLKSLEEQLRFVFVTGVSKFSKVSLFSGMNNLDDLSLDANYATLTGITEEEIRTHLSESLDRLAATQETSAGEILDEMRRWYNGYSFSPLAESPRVFNPWSIFKYLSTGMKKNYWFSTGTPTFAIELIKERSFPVFSFEHGIQAGNEIEANHEVKGLSLISLLFQTGYLTIDRYDQEAQVYHLRLPNEEVRRSLMEHLFLSFSLPDAWETQRFLDQLKEALLQGDLKAFFSHFNKLLGRIPYPIHNPNEGYYHSLIYLCLWMLDFDVEAEVVTSGGRVDLVVRTEETVYLFEFKIDHSAQMALDQIKKKQYARRYELKKIPLRLVGANFDSKARSVTEWVDEALPVTL